MREKRHPREIEEARVDLRLVREHVQAGGGDLEYERVSENSGTNVAVFERPDQRRLVDNLAQRGVDDDRAWL